MVPFCSICNQSQASYVCRECGRLACGKCFDTSQWVCAQCQIHHDQPSRSVVSGATTGLWVLFIAFGMIFLGILLLMIGPFSSLGVVSSGGVILIGPIPILFGNGTYSTPLILVSAVMTIFALIFFVFAVRRAH